MPRSVIGQGITFAIEVDADQKFQSRIWVEVKKGDTVQKIVSRRGHPEQAREVADLNDIASVRSVLKRKRLRVPGNLRQASVFHVYAGDDPPRIVDGYAKLETVDRPSRVGLTQFSGYNPIMFEVPIRFEAYLLGEGVQIERDIELLERMAGRGHFSGAGVGPPPIIRVSVTDNKGNNVPLIPNNYQWSKQNPSAPLWRVAGIEWEDGALRNSVGNRIRQLATVTLQQHTRITLATRSVTQRTKARKKKTKKKPSKK